jgi:hypothetical protein
MKASMKKINGNSPNINKAILAVLLMNIAALPSYGY